MRSKRSRFGNPDATSLFFDAISFTERHEATKIADTGATLAERARARAPLNLRRDSGRHARGFARHTIGKDSDCASRAFLRGVVIAVINWRQLLRRSRNTFLRALGEPPLPPWSVKWNIIGQDDAAQFQEVNLGMHSYAE